MSELSDFFDVQGHDGISRKFNEASGFVHVTSLDDAGCAWTHRLPKGEGDAEGLGWQVLSAKHLLSPFYTYNITPAGTKVND